MRPMFQSTQEMRGYQVLDDAFNAKEWARDHRTSNGSAIMTRLIMDLISDAII